MRTPRALVLGAPNVASSFRDLRRRLLHVRPGSDAAVFCSVVTFLALHRVSPRSDIPGLRPRCLRCCRDHGVRTWINLAYVSHHASRPCHRPPAFRGRSRGTRPHADGTQSPSASTARARCTGSAWRARPDSRATTPSSFRIAAETARRTRPPCPATLHCRRMHKSRSSRLLAARLRHSGSFHVLESSLSPHIGVHDSIAEPNETMATSRPTSTMRPGS